MEFGECAICHHGDRVAIEAMFESGGTAGAVAAEFGVDLVTAGRHLVHYPRDPTTRSEGPVLAALRDSMRRARSYETEAHAAGRPNDALRALKEGRTLAEQIARLDPLAIRHPEKGVVWLSRWGEHRRAHQESGSGEQMDGVTGPAPDSILAALWDMMRRARIYEAEARDAGRPNDALRAVKEGRTIAELIARLDPEAIAPPKGTVRWLAVWGDGTLAADSAENEK
jgi:hypothetical protein